jgi:hypothetical protein
MPSSKKHSQQKEAFCKKEADRQSNLSTSVSVSQFLFFQPAFLLATTWQPHEQISFQFYGLKKWRRMNPKHVRAQERS